METEVLAGLIDKKYEVLSSLRQLARAQVNVVRDGEMTRLMKLLAAKKDLLQQLQDVEHQIDPFRGQDPESRQWRSPQRREQVRDMTTRCESLLNEIMLVEKQCEGELVVRRDAAASRLQDIHSVTQAAAAYLSNGPAHSQLDLSSDT